MLAANAGLSRPGSWEDVDAQAFDETVAVNLRAPYLLARRVLPGDARARLRPHPLTSSVAALTGGLAGPHYASSKAGLHGLTHFLASRVAANGASVNAIAPALIEDTGMLHGVPARLAKAVPVGRLEGGGGGRPRAMLRNGYLTSKVVMLDGGIHPRGARGVHLPRGPRPGPRVDALLGDLAG